MSNSKSVKAVFVISVAAELAGMHPQTLRIYEGKGLLGPFRHPGWTRGNARDDIERLQLIQDLTGQGLNLEGVKRVLALQEENRQLKAKLERLQGRVEEVERQASRIADEVHRSYRHEIILRKDVRPYLGASDE